MPSKENLEIVLKVLKDRKMIWNLTELCDKMGISDGYLRMVRKGTKPITEKLVKKICKLYPLVNYYFLMDGEGEVLLSQPREDMPYTNVTGGSQNVQAGGNVTINNAADLEARLADAQKQIEMISKMLEQSTKLNEWLQAQLNKYTK